MGFWIYFARHRKSRGKPAVAIGSGTINEIGHLHEHPEIEQIFEQRGLTATTEADFPSICDIALRSRQSGHILTGLELSNRRAIWQQGYEGAAQDEMVDSRLSMLLHAEKDKLERGMERFAKDGLLPEAIAAAVAKRGRHEITRRVLDCLAMKLSQLVLMPVGKIPPGTTQSSVGMDSMLATEYRTFIFRTMEVHVPFLALMDVKATMKDIAMVLADGLSATPSDH